MPSPTYQEIPLTFEKGLVLETEESVLGEGMAAALTNWTPEHTGGLRARNRWRAISETGLTDTTYNVRGWGSIGVTSAPAIVQYMGTNEGGGATRNVGLTGVQPGSVIIIVLLSGGANDDALGTGMSGYTEVSNIASATNTSIRMFTKVSSGGTETATPGFTNAFTTNYAFMLEVININPTADDADGTTDTDTSMTVTSTPTTDLSFMLIARVSNSIATATNTRPTFDTVLHESGDGGTGSNPRSLGAYTSGLVGAQNFTWTTSDASNAQRGAVATFKATNRSSRSFYVVMANAIADARLTSAIAGTAYLTSSETVDPTDQASYLSPSSAPTVSGAVLFAVVGSRKATTPDIPTATGTGGYSGTWTQVATKLTDGGTRRLTVFTSTATSTSSGQVTAAFGASQLTGGIFLFQMSATTLDAVTPTVQTVTNSGTGTSMTATLATFSDSTNIPALFVLTAATTTNAIVPADDLAEVRETTTTGEGLQLGAFVGYDSDNLTPEVVGQTSYEWAAIAVELDTVGYTGTGYRIWQIPKDELDSGTWSYVDEVANLTSNSSLVAFAQGAGALIYTADTMAYPRHIELASGTATNITDIASPGRAICYHKNRFFMTGSLSNPARVYFSDLSDGTNWGVNSYFDLNADDGETAEDMVSVEGLLLVAKTNQTFLISGSGIESFFVNSLSGGSSATGRSLAKTPYGTILSGTYEMWSVQGGGVDPLSRPLGSGYSISGYVSSAYASDKAYTLDSGTGMIYVQDLVTGAFSLESVTHTDTPHVLFAVGRTLIYGCDSATTYLGGYRSLADTRLGDVPATSTTYTASTPLTFLLGPQVKYTPRHLFLQVRRQDSTAVAPVTVTVETPSGSRSWDVTPNAVVARERLDIAFTQGQSWVQVHFSQTVGPNSGPTDIERVILGVDVERVR